MSKLAEFVLARIAEDEAKAVRAAEEARDPEIRDEFLSDLSDAAVQERYDSRRSARRDEVRFKYQAKRQQAIDYSAIVMANFAAANGEASEDRTFELRRSALVELARQHADHPDFDEAWLD